MGLEQSRRHISRVMCHHPTSCILNWPLIYLQLLLLFLEFSWDFTELISGRSSLLKTHKRSRRSSEKETGISESEINIEHSSNTYLFKFNFNIGVKY